jgi:hypothetical protein
MSLTTATAGERFYQSFALERKVRSGVAAGNG